MNCNWSRTSQMKGCAPSMHKGLRKVIERRYETVTIDEYRTSIRCHYCKKEIQNVKIPSNCGKSGTKKLYRCLVCVGCQSSKSVNEIPKRYINRDRNGGMNILECMKEWIENKRRPDGLKRETLLTDKVDNRTQGRHLLKLTIKTKASRSQ